MLVYTTVGSLEDSGQMEKKVCHRVLSVCGKKTWEYPAASGGEAGPRGAVGGASGGYSLIGQRMEFWTVSCLSFPPGEQGT